MLVAAVDVTGEAMVQDSRNEALVDTPPVFDPVRKGTAEVSHQRLRVEAILGYIPYWEPDGVDLAVIAMGSDSWFLARGKGTLVEKLNLVNGGVSPGGFSFLPNVLVHSPFRERFGRLTIDHSVQVYDPVARKEVRQVAALKGANGHPFSSCWPFWYILPDPIGGLEVPSRSEFMGSEWTPGLNEQGATEQHRHQR